MHDRDVGHTPGAGSRNNAYLLDNQNVGGTDGWYFRLAFSHFRLGRKVSSVDAQTDGVATVVAGTRYHSVASFDGSLAQLYVNGALDKTGAADPGVLTNPTSNFEIGQSLGTGNIYDGIIDEVAVYNAALSGVSILSHYNTGVLDLAPAHFNRLNSL